MPADAADLAKRNSTNATVLYDPSAFDGRGWPLQVSWNNWVDPTLTWLAKAVGEVGLPISSEGFESGTWSVTAPGYRQTIEPKNAHRSSPESSFLRVAIDNTGLITYTHTSATKIIFDSSSPPKAVGVEVHTRGLKYTVSAQKEVVLSAGVFHSPQLLMLSGKNIPLK